ncbi:MAG TPA: hypothetical protein VK866_15040 [Acidimicrobiales bacterium]|nr:hypothetical protein [Acidimicrobiales bacterium]
MEATSADDATGAGGRRRCPQCGEPAPERVWLAVPRVDACACRACGATWNEDEQGRRRGPVATAASPSLW